jgi:hypothetical protein
MEGPTATDQERLRDFSRLLFGRELFLPVSLWILDHRREEISFTPLRDQLREWGLKAPDGPTSDELKKIRALGMIQALPPVGTTRPSGFVKHPLWRVVEGSLQIGRTWGEASTPRNPS